MKHGYYILFFLVLSMGLHAQKKVYTLSADSVKITSCDSAELILENHTQNVPGFLFNTGNGRTIFKRGAQQLSSGSFLVGSDTVKAWVLGGNAFGTTSFLGTKDTNTLDLIQHNTLRMRFFNNGDVGINQAADIGFKLDINGITRSTQGLTLQGPLSFNGTAAQNLVYGNSITFLTNNAQGNFQDGDYNFSNAIPVANTGIGHYRLIHVNQLVNRGTQDGEVTAIRVDFAVTGTANDLRAFHAARGNVVVDTGNVVIGATTGSTSRLDITGSNGFSQLRLRTQYTPSSSADTNGNVGDIAVDDNYFYYKTSVGWKRLPMGTF